MWYYEGLKSLELNLVFESWVSVRSSAWLSLLNINPAFAFQSQNSSLMFVRLVFIAFQTEGLSELTL